jgi:hypothetical protein
LAESFTGYSLHHFESNFVPAATWKEGCLDQSVGVYMLHIYTCQVSRFKASNHTLMRIPFIPTPTQKSNGGRTFNCGWSRQPCKKRPNKLVYTTIIYPYFMQTKLYKSLKFMDNHLTFGKVHPLAKSTTYNIRDIARIPIRLKILVFW